MRQQPCARRDDGRAARMEAPHPHGRRTGAVCGILVLLGALAACNGAQPGTGSRPVPAPPSASAAGAEGSRRLSILGAGDVLLHSSVWRQAAAAAAAEGRSGYDFRRLFAAVAPQIAAADLAVCHLETPLGAPAGPFSGYPRFTVPPQIAVALRATGFDTCSTASNHTLDAGERGVYRTLDVLDAAGLRHAGSYRSLTAQQTPTILAVAGVPVAHLSYTFGFNGLHRPRGKPWIANLIDPVAIIAEATRARTAGAEIVVVSLHWGTEYDHRPDAAQVRLARRLLAGPEIDLILGSHTHVVQPLESIRGKWVAYGMGNQIARQADTEPGRREGVMPRFTFTRRAPGRWAVTSVEAVATWIEVTPTVHIVNLPGALANPATPTNRRRSYLSAHYRIAAYLRALGADLVYIGENQ